MRELLRLAGAAPHTHGHTTHTDHAHRRPSPHDAEGKGVEGEGEDESEGKLGQAPTLDELLEAVPVGASLKRILHTLELSRLPDRRRERLPVRQRQSHRPNGASSKAHESGGDAVVGVRAAVHVSSSGTATRTIASDTATAATAATAATTTVAGVAQAADAMPSAGRSFTTAKGLEDKEGEDSEEEDDVAEEEEEDTEEEEDSLPSVVDKPLPYRAVDIERFRELLALAPSHAAAPPSADASADVSADSEANGHSLGSVVRVLNASEAAGSAHQISDDGQLHRMRSWEEELDEF